MAPRDQPSVSALSADVQSLRNENDTLREQQRELQARLAEMQRTLAGEREEHRRFRESMRTNFDLLERFGIPVDPKYKNMHAWMNRLKARPSYAESAD